LLSLLGFSSSHLGTAYFSVAELLEEKEIEGRKSLTTKEQKIREK
jgi:hypothetical protein